MTFVWPCSNLGIAHPAGESPNSREQAVVFRRLAEFARAGRAYSWMKNRFQMSPHQVETRVALFQELGLLYARAGEDRLQVTAAGEQLLDLLLSTQRYGKRETAQSTALIAWTLSNIQIRRPLSPGSPTLTVAERAACDVRPCAAAWSMMLDLGGILYMHEFLGPIRRLQRVRDYDACVERIMRARVQGTIFVQRAEWASRAPLMNPSIYWKSRLSVAGRLLHYDNAEEHFAFALGGENLVLALIDAQSDESREDDMAFLSAVEWQDVEGYYRIAGRQCPAEVAGTFVEVLADAVPPANGNGPAPLPPASSPEGRRQYRLQAFTERNSALSREAKRMNAVQHGGVITCEACDFGNTDSALFDAHHERPLAGGVRQTQVTDLKILCPTCHRRTHRTANVLVPLTIAELRQWVAAGRP